MNIDVEFIGASCNLTYNCLELTSDMLIFGSNHAIALYDLQEMKVVKTYVQHTGRVNCVRFLKESNDKFILSAGADGQLVLWERFCDTENAGTTSQGQIAESKYLIQAKICHHSTPKTPITVCDGILLENDKASIGYISALSTVYLGLANLVDGEYSVFQEISLKQSVALDLFFDVLDSDIMLGLGMDSGEVALYGSPLCTGSLPEPFTKICGLNKHEDWVRCLAITTLENGERLLATGGEDAYIAIWRLKGDASIITEDFEFQLLKFKTRSIVFDSMIIGHEGWINSLQWNTKGELISCSSDQTIIIWNNISGVWEEKCRLGVMGGQIPGGFCSRFSEGFVATSGFQGAVQIWSWSEESGEWSIEPSVTGHFKSVTDLDYDSEGRYVVTTSTDQTSRIFCQWGPNRWHEIARPQIHGHDIFALKCVDEYIVSGAEEKMLRVFQPTKVFVSTFESATGSPMSLTYVSDAASVPALGLSNLSQEHSELVTKRFAETLDEDFLRSNTLWPEISKLYGHGYEICSIGASAKDSLFVSGCNSTTTQFSTIIMWSSLTWKILGEFRFHKLNVSNLEFAKNGKLLLSVSRDRSWAVWKVIPPGARTEFSLDLQEHGSGHTRALTVGTWHPTGNYFLTGGRDKRLFVWKAEHPTEFRDYTKAFVETFEHPVTAAAVNAENVIAVGLESGFIFILLLNSESTEMKLTCLKQLSHSDAHHGLVSRLQFNPKDNSQLASASADHAVKIYKLTPLPLK